MKTTWDDYSKSTTIFKDIETTRSGSSEFGKSTIHIICPFCERETTAYIWSISGAGKRCNNTKCGAMLTDRGRAFKNGE